MKTSANLIVTPLLLAVLALAPVGAQENSTQNQAPDKPQQLTLQQGESENEEVPVTPVRRSMTPELPTVRELQVRPHGRSRIDPAPPPRPLIEVKRL